MDLVNEPIDSFETDLAGTYKDITLTNLVS